MAKSVEVKRPPRRHPSMAVSMSARKPPAEPIELPDTMWQRIAQKAYELYEQRGMQEGYALNDWLEAEAIVMKEIHGTRE
jgi:DUF2934 family protein